MRIAGGLAIALVLAGVLCAEPTRGADDYPVRPVTIIVPFAPGGSTDVLARYAAEVLQRELDQPFVVQNRAGAGGVLGISYVAKADPDGYTLLHTPTAFVLIPHIVKNLPYDPLSDFAPVSPIGITNFIVVVSPSLNVGSVQELISLAKAEPGRLTYASAGPGTTQHLFAELFKSMAGVDIRHVPYKGSAPGLLDVMSGQVSLMFVDIGPAIELVRDGKVKALAVTSSTRNADLPQLPTVAETLPGYEAFGWQGLLAKSQTPKSIVRKLNMLLTADLRRPATAARFKQIGIDPKFGTPEEFQAWIGSQILKWGKVIRTAGIKAE